MYPAHMHTYALTYVEIYWKIPISNLLHRLKIKLKPISQL